MTVVPNHQGSEMSGAEMTGADFTRVRSEGAEIVVVPKCL